MSTSRSSIEWTDATWSPTRGCSRVSPGCANCYAERQARRFAGLGGAYEGLLHPTGAWNGQIRLVPEVLKDPLRWARGRRVFVDSMSDLFHEGVPFDFVDQVFAIMSATHRHTYQILTKRPQRMLGWFARLTPDPLFGMEAGPEQVTAHKVRLRGGPKQSPHHGGYDNCGLDWPLANVWLGVSVENQETADQRIPLLLQTPAALHFLSCEPLLEAVDLRLRDRASRPGWVIVGGESGPGARPFNTAWAVSIVEQCRAAEVPVFVKQLGAKPYYEYYSHFERQPLPGERISIQQAEIRLDFRLSDRKGGNIDEWPQWLRIRQFPVLATAYRNGRPAVQTTEEIG